MHHQCEIILTFFSTKYYKRSRTTPLKTASHIFCNKKRPKNILSVFLIRSSVMESVVSAVLLLLDTFERIQINSRTMVNPSWKTTKRAIPLSPLCSQTITPCCEKQYLIPQRCLKCDFLFNFFVCKFWCPKSSIWGVVCRYYILWFSSQI